MATRRLFGQTYDEIAIVAAVPIPVDIGSAVVNIGTSVEISNNEGNPLPVSGSVSITGTVAISAASLPLPAGAATEAKQPAPGTAGAPSVDVLTVQGVSGGTALPVAPNVTRGGGASDANTQRVTLATDGPGVASLSSIAGLSIPAHDFIALSYTGADLTGVAYRTGGAGGTTVGTLTLAYSGGALASVTKS
jgi:hypothetical protein